LYNGPRRVGEVLEKDIVVLAAPKAAGAEKVVPGLVERRYDWTAAAPADGRVPANGLPATFLDLPADARPYAQAPVAAPAGNDCLRRLVEYRGFFRAAREGVYAFRLDPRGVNGLRIGGVDVTHNRLLGPRGPGCVYLEAGLHELSLRVGVGKATLEAKAPGADGFEPVSTADLLRPARVPAARQTDRLAAYLPFEDLAGGRMAVKGESPEATATVEAAEIVAEGRAGKALRCVEPAAKVVVEGLKMLDDEATFAIWLKRERLTDGYLLVAPDKFAVRLRGKGIWAAYHRSPDIVSVNGDKAVEPDKWFHLAVSFGEEVRVYLNGELRDSAQVDRSAFHTQATDARAGQLILFNEPWGRGPVPAVADEARLYNRVLTAEEILRLAEGAAPEGAQK
ncbi:MAG TPA: LamG domain-containing protein, partial [Phycisphaerae bacterium]|nr:LamG domain-containing protein [Phycisphaerae bacterium]